LWAHVQVELALEYEQFLAKEPLVVAVRITNFSGQKLHLGKDPGWLKFGVEAREGFVVAKLADAPVLGEFDVESSKLAVRRVELAPYFEIVRPGRYSITATVSVPEWKQDLSPPPQTFDVVGGTKLWEQEFGLPFKEREAGAPPEVRKYALVQVN